MPGKVVPTTVLSPALGVWLSSLDDSLDTLVIDEADLVLSFGGEDDIREIIDYVPKTVQTMLMSA